jgi:hypothetical protein
MDIQCEQIVPDKQWVSDHNDRISRMLIPNPWNDPMVKKVGLYDMYIIDALCEALELSAEAEPEVKLGIMNPQYTKFHGMVTDYLESPSKDGFLSILAFSHAHLKRPVKLIKWVSNTNQDSKTWPDIRVLDTPDECLSWLARLI